MTIDLLTAPVDLDPTHGNWLVDPPRLPMLTTRGPTVVESSQEGTSPGTIRTMVAGRPPRGRPVFPEREKGGIRMDIGRTEGVGGPGRIEGLHPLSKVRPPVPASPPPADRVEISEEARLVSEALCLPAVRSERVEEIRHLIRSGRFETDARLEGALQRFLEENRDVLE